VVLMVCVCCDVSASIQGVKQQPLLMVGGMCYLALLLPAVEKLQLASTVLLM
jgi:hypothetical protein